MMRLDTGTPGTRVASLAVLPFGLLSLLRLGGPGLGLRVGAPWVVTSKCGLEFKNKLWNVNL